MNILEIEIEGTMDMADTEIKEVRMIDIRGGEVEIKITVNTANRKKVWVNVDGICYLRIMLPESMVLDLNNEFVDLEK